MGFSMFSSFCLVARNNWDKFADLYCWKAVKALQDTSSDSSQGSPFSSGRPERQISTLKNHSFSK